MQLNFKKNLLLITIIIFAFGLRLIHSNQSFWLDEAAQALESARPLSEQFDIIGDFQPPLFHLIVYAFELFNKSEFWLRLASIIPGVITIWYAAQIAKKIYGETPAVLTAMIGALSAYHYYYSQELRPYSLSAMFAVISMHAYFSLMDKKSKKINGTYILASVLALYSMYVSVFLFVFQLITAVFLYPKKIVSLVKHQLVVGLVFLPWLPKFIEQLQSGMTLKSEYIGWSTAVSLPWQKSLPLTGVRFLIGMIKVDLNLIQISLFLVLGVGILYLITKAARQMEGKVVLLWLSIPILSAFLVSFFIPVLEPKRVLFCLPALWILMGKGIETLQLKTWKLIVLCALYALPISWHIGSQSMLREDWKSSVSYIEAKANSSSVVMFVFPGEFAPFSWYRKETIDTIATEVFIVEDIAFLNENLKDVLLYDQIFIYDYLMDLSDPQRITHSWLKTNGFKEASVTDFRGVGFVRTYVRMTPVAGLQ